MVCVYKTGALYNVVLTCYGLHIRLVHACGGGREGGDD